MKRSKKALALFLALVMCIGVLAGCGGNNTANNSANNTTDDTTEDTSATPLVVSVEQGLEAYRSGMEPLYQLLLAAGEGNTDFTYWDEATQTAFWGEGLAAAGEAFAQSIVDYCVANYAGSYASDIGSTTDDIMNSEGLQVVFGMVEWGFGSPEVADDGTLAGFTDFMGNTYDVVNGTYPTLADYWANIVAKYDGDYQTASDTEVASGALWSPVSLRMRLGSTISVLTSL